MGYTRTWCIASPTTSSRLLGPLASIAETVTAEMRTRRWQGTSNGNMQTLYRPHQPHGRQQQKRVTSGKHHKRGGGKEIVSLTAAVLSQWRERGANAYARDPASLRLAGDDGLGRGLAVAGAQEVAARGSKGCVECVAMRCDAGLQRGTLRPSRLGTGTHKMPIGKKRMHRMMVMGPMTGVEPLWRGNVERRGAT